MQETKEDLTVNVPTFDGVPMIPRGLTNPYEQQVQDINNMSQISEMTNELHKQLNLLEERADLCIKVKDKALKEEKRQRGYLQTSLATAVAEIGYWKKLVDKKIIELKDKAFEEEKKKCGEMQIRLNKALSETVYWRMLSDQKTKLCSDLAEKLMEVRKRDIILRKKRNVENKYPEEAHSSTGDNGDDYAESSMNIWRKRPRH